MKSIPKSVPACDTTLSGERLEFELTIDEGEIDGMAVSAIRMIMVHKLEAPMTEIAEKLGLPVELISLLEKNNGDKLGMGLVAGKCVLDIHLSPQSVRLLIDGLNDFLADLEDKVPANPLSCPGEC